MAIVSKVIDKDLGWKHIKEQAAILGKKPMAVIGIRGKQAEEGKKEADGTVATITLAEIATIHEYGAPGANIPERSFIRATVDENLPTYRDILEKLKSEIFKSQSKMSVRRALLILGEKVKADIQTKIRSGLHPSWAESTRESRISRSGGNIIAETPLIDTGQLINGVTNEVEFKDGGKVT